MGNQSFNRDSCQNLCGKSYRSYKGDVGPAVQNEVTRQESRAKRSCSGACPGVSMQKSYEMVEMMKLGVIARAEGA